MNKLKQIAIAILWSVSCLFCWQIGRDCGVDREAHDKVPTIKDVQKMVGAFEDGKFGPETEYLWNRAICNQIAAQNSYDETGRPE
jgi:hypothetical protein